MRNVAGIAQTESQKSSDLFMKCRYMDEITGGKGIIFATGTPVSNTMAEMYTMQRYLQYAELDRMGLLHFDCWASIFGETTTSLEIAPEGNGFRARTRFAKFHNLPELMATFRCVADIQTADMLNLPVPLAKFETVLVEPSEIQKKMVNDLSERAGAVQRREVSPEVDNMLRITTDGRKIGLDQRLMNPLLPDDPNSKVNACMDKIFEVWNDTKNERLTQLVFCDFSTPHNKSKASVVYGDDGDSTDTTPLFSNVYDDIKTKLLSKGIPEHEIAFIHDADTETRKKELFAKVRQGKIRVLFGSTFKMGAGTNVQDKLVVSHDLDCPWRPSDIEQRNGRILRQGNSFEKVDIFHYLTEKTFDAYLMQIITNKQKFISQLMNGNTTARTCEDFDDKILSYAEMQSLASGDPRIKERIDTDVRLKELQVLEAAHKKSKFEMQDVLRNAPKELERLNGALAKAKADRAKRIPQEFAIEINGVTYTERAEADRQILKEVLKAQAKYDESEHVIGKYGTSDTAFEVAVKSGSSHRLFSQEAQLILRGELNYSTEASRTDNARNTIRIENLAQSGIDKRIENIESNIAKITANLEQAKAKVDEPFKYAEEVKTLSARLDELDEMFRMDDVAIGDGDEVKTKDVANAAEKTTEPPVEDLSYAVKR
ncbi:hypothetical protein FACS1894133_5310 [Clostridia bacterium]|nr:hypothetical protein FACS1894133_5310 [Clostridia bacterium]